MSHYISDQDFQMFSFILGNIFKRAGYDENLAKFLLQDKLMWIKVFTPKSVDQINNYEHFEFLGDAVIERFIKFNVSKRYPHLCTSAGVGTLARLSSKLVSKPVLAKLATQLGFAQLIRHRAGNVSFPLNVSVLEDSLEAFIGALALGLERWVAQANPEENLMHAMLSKIYQNEDFSTERLVDYKTMLKELSDRRAHEIGTVKYVHSMEGDKNASSLYLVKSGSERFVGRCVHKSKKEAEKMVAEIALQLLQREGFAVHINYDKLVI